MKHTTFYQQGSGEGLKEKVEEWIKNNEDYILEVIDVEYQNYESVYAATITYMD